MYGSVVVPILALVIGAQQTPPFLTFERLVASVPQAPPSAGDRNVGAQEVAVTWSGPAAAALDPRKPSAGPTNSFEVTGRRQGVGALPIERNPELSADQLVVVGAEADGSVVSWSVIKDPRVVRAEQARPDGVLGGRVLYRGEASLLLILPDSPRITQASIYEPSWTGAEWELTLLGSFNLAVSR